MNLAVLSYFTIRFVALIAVWVITLKFVKSNEYSNARIDWQDYRIMSPETTYDSSQWAALAAIALGVVFAFETLQSGIIEIDFLRKAMFGAQLCFAFCYLIFYEDTVKRAHRACIHRNQPRLDRLVERWHEDNIVIFSRKCDVKIEPPWRHVTEVGNFWFIEQNPRGNAKIIEFPQ